MGYHCTLCICSHYYYLYQRGPNLFMKYYYYYYYHHHLSYRHTNDQLFSTHSIQRGSYTQDVGWAVPIYSFLHPSLFGFLLLWPKTVGCRYSTIIIIISPLGILMISCSALIAYGEDHLLRMEWWAITILCILLVIIIICVIIMLRQPQNIGFITFKVGYDSFFPKKRPKRKTNNKGREKEWTLHNASICCFFILIIWHWTHHIHCDNVICKACGWFH